jgi:hypothetical protein
MTERRTICSRILTGFAAFLVAASASANGNGVPVEPSNFASTNVVPAHDGGLNPCWFQLSTKMISRTVSGQQSFTITNQDAVIPSNVSSTARTDWELTANALHGIEAITWSSSDTNVASVDPNGFASWRANGYCTITAASPDCTQSVNLTFSTQVNQGALLATNGVARSVRRVATDLIDSLIVPWGSRSLKRFSTVSHAATNYVRNLKFWGMPLDFSPFTVYNSTRNPYRGDAFDRPAGTLISPRHLLCVSHTGNFDVGCEVRFIDTNGVVIIRHVTGVSYRPSGVDLLVSVLDFDVPGSVNFVRIPPHDLDKKLPNTGYTRDPIPGPPNGANIPVVGLTQFFVADVEELCYLRTNSAYGVSTRVPMAPWRSELYVPKISGDSGHAVCIWTAPSPAPPVLLYLFASTTSGPTGCGTYRPIIERAMRALGGGHSTLTEADWSSFNSY